MFKNPFTILQCAKNIAISPKRSFHKTTILREKWDLLTAVLIERKPVIVPELNELEKDFKDYLSTSEFEKSLKSDIEINLEKEKKLFAQRKDIDEIDTKFKQSTQDFIDACKEELSKFKPAERITVADKSNDQKSLERKLDKQLILLINQKVGEKSYFILPQGEMQGGETLRQCVDRVLKEKCGEDIKAQVFGNAPCGFYKYKYPKEVKNSKNSIGAKVFIYFARYSSGQVTGKNIDFKWLDKSELDKVLPQPYKKSVLPIVFD